MTAARDDIRPRLLSIATAVPTHLMDQEDILRESRALLQSRFAQFDRLAPAFRNAGIDRRYSVVPLDWFRQPHGWVDRTAAFAAGAAYLFRQAAGAALDQAGLRAQEVDVIVTVCSTGIVTPTLEALVARDMGFQTDAMRVPVFGLSCAGGVSGLSVAADLGSRPIDFRLLA